MSRRHHDIKELPSGKCLLWRDWRDKLEGLDPRDAAKRLKTVFEEALPEQCCAHVAGGTFAGDDLSDAIFRNLDLSGCVFIDTNLQCATFENCNLAGADFTHAGLDGCAFNGCNLDGVIWTLADTVTATIDGLPFDSRPTGRSSVARMLTIT